MNPHLRKLKATARLRRHGDQTDDAKDCRGATGVHSHEDDAARGDDVKVRPDSLTQCGSESISSSLEIGSAQKAAILLLKMPFKIGSFNVFPSFTVMMLG